jgi:uncharacterized protein (DUF305 family)
MEHPMTPLKTAAAAAGLLALGIIIGSQASPFVSAFAEDAPKGGMQMDHNMMDHGMMNHGDMPGMGHDMAAADPNAPASTKAFIEANARMHKDMAIAYSGNADIDFVRGMIPHHQGAIDMAKIVLDHGKDAEIRTLAEGIIQAQESEIAEMQAWLKKAAP